MIFVILALAVWRVSSLLARENGPFDILARARYKIGVRYNEFSEPIGTNAISKGIICVWCNSVWVSLIGSFIVFNTIHEILVSTFALSAIAIIIEEKL